MRSLILKETLLIAALSLCALLPTPKAAAKDTEKVPDNFGGTIVREFYDDESLKTVTRLDAQGRTLGTFYYAPKGIPLRLDEFDSDKRVVKNTFYKPDGVPERTQELDEKGTVTFVRVFTYEAKKLDDEPVPKSIRMQFVTPNGRVGFTADGAWHEIGLQPKLPIAAIGFQIKSEADEGTPDSTNLAVSLYDATSDDAKARHKRLLGERATGNIAKTKYRNWGRWTYPGRQNETPYTICDAFQERGDVIISIRLAWPKLTDNPAGYDARMEKILLSLLDSVSEDK